ncbi:hypothetical protein T08_12055 [Trichinella sp. T8]|nr:hypothetical protein T08_12055 [Trichinella sp. T8]
MNDCHSKKFHLLNIRFLSMKTTAILVSAIYSFVSVSILKVVYFYHAECMNTVQKNPNRNSCFACQINYILARNYADCSLKIFPDPENPYQRILL